MGLKSRKTRDEEKATEEQQAPTTGGDEGTSSNLTPLRDNFQYEFINDYLLSDELRAIKEVTRDFCEAEILKLVDDPRDSFVEGPQIQKLLDGTQGDISRADLEALISGKPHKIPRNRAQEFLGREGRAPLDLWDKMAELGFFSIGFPEKYGGLGLGELGNVALLEEVGKYDGGLGTMIGVQIGLWQMPILLDGTEEQKEQYLTPSIAGTMKGAFALTEPGAGSDATNLQTTAKEKDGYFVLNGGKQFISSASHADYFLVFAVTDPDLQPGRGTSALLVPADAPGVTIGPHEDKMGIRMSETVPISFDDVKVPIENILGGEERRGKGLFTAMRAIDVSRLTLAAGVIGGNVTAINKALDFASTREVAGGLLINKENFQEDIGRIAAETYAMATTVYTLAKTVDDWIEEGAPMEGYRSPFTALSAVVKGLAPTKGREAIHTALVYHGGYGYIEEYGLAKLYRDQLIVELYEGTTFTNLREVWKWLREAGEYTLH